VQLDGIGAGLFHLFGVVEPAARGAAVEGGNHRDLDGFLDPAELLQVLIRPEHEIVGAGEVGQGLGEGFCRDVHVVNGSEALGCQLLLEQGPHDDGRRSRILEFADRVKVVRQGRRAGHEGVRHLEPKIGCRQIHESILQLAGAPSGLDPAGGLR